MDHISFTKFLKRGGRSESTVKRCLKMVGIFQDFLNDQRGGITPDQAKHSDLESFVDWLEQTPKSSAKTHLWAIRYYFEFTSNEEMKIFASKLRQQRIKRTPFNIKNFRGVDQNHVKRLAAVGIKNVSQMLEAGRTPSDRSSLSEMTGIPIENILEIVKLSDLSRLGGVKTIRARLYHDSRVDTVEKIAQLEPKELRAKMVEFVERTGFDGIATLPKEAEYTIEAARRLPKIIEYE